MDNQQGHTAYCIPHGTLLHVMWQPGWGGFGDSGYVYVWLSPFNVHLEL